MAANSDKDRAQPVSAKEDFGPSSSELLDLVRSAEDDARLGLRKRTPAVGIAPAKAVEEIVEVGDEAIDAPPSHPPFVAARSPAKELASSASHTRPSAAGGLSPALSVLLIFGIAVGVLALLAR